MKVVILATGGTISGYSSDRLDVKDYTIGHSSITDLLQHIPECHALAQIETEQLGNIDSTDVTPEHWQLLEQKTEWYLQQEDVAGVVITHGTNTIEETAYFLNLTINSEKPVVLVGSMKPPSALGTDAYANLYQAIRVAVHPASVGKGVLVVLNDQINAARDVTKTNTYRLETFRSGDLGLLGYVDVDGDVVYYRKPLKKHTIQSQFSTEKVKHYPKVGIVYSYAGSGGELIRHIVEQKLFEGIVVAGMGAGKMSKPDKQWLLTAAQNNICVVRSHRTGNGRVVAINEYAGTEFIAADNLNPQKARVLLILALTQTRDPQDIQHIFDRY